MIEAFQVIAKMEKPYMLSSMLITFVNAWCINHRFQGATLPCHLGCGDALGDTLEHYIACPRVFAFIVGTCPWLPSNPSSFPSILHLLLHYVESADKHHCATAIAVLLHVIRSAYEGRRAARQATGCSHSWESDILEPTLATCFCKDRGIRRFLLPPELQQRASGVKTKNRL